MGRVHPVELVGPALLRYAIVPVSGLMVSVLIEHQNTIGVNSVGPSSWKSGPRTFDDARSDRLAFRIGLRDRIEAGLILVRATTASPMVAATRLCARE